MKNYLPLSALLMGFTGVVMTQSVTVNMPSGYKMVVAPDSVNVSQTVSIAAVPRTIYVAPAPAPACRPYPYAHRLTNVGKGVVIEHQTDGHHH